MREHRSLRLLAILVASGCVLLASSSLAAADKKNEKKMGILEGTILSQDGKPLSLTILVMKPGSRGVHYGKTISRIAEGGFYSVTVDPGVYEVWIKNDKDTSKGYCPQRYLAVEIKAGTKTVLKARLKQGEELEEIGKADIPAEKAESVTLALERLKKQVEAQKKEIEALKKEIEALKKR